ncbi:hypothetical protein GCM10023149_29450 [Mucilaginibacter gynuensis]|uniref:Endosialidase-like protein n=1 Tax=Mucilaginibacter gynuensis TaxID=1302236 RepID=A0ABP8GLH1_9SPHI
MNYFKLSAALMMAASAFNAGAQIKPAGYPQSAVNNYSSIIMQLRPVAMHADENTEKAQYSMDVSNIQEILPFAIGTKTIWLKAGKNSTTATDQPVVEPERLVPLIIGALKEQILRVDSLEHELRLIKSKNPVSKKTEKLSR